VHNHRKNKSALVEKKELQRAELKKHIAAIHINNKLSLLQRKIANVLLVNAYDDLLTQETHTIKTSHLALVVGYDSNDWDTLKNALVGLAETSLQGNIPNNSGDEEWGVSTMLAEAIIERGVCRYSYSPGLRKKLYSPEIYARINLAIQRAFTSGYGLVLYENCTRFRGVGSTGWWSIDTFRALLGLKDDEYSQFKDLNKWVIKPAIKQVNENSDVVVDPEYRRQKRRIVALRFQVKDNPQMPLSFPLAKGGTLEPWLESELMTSTGGVIERLQKFGFTFAKARAAVKKHGVEYVAQNLDTVERDYQAGKVTNLPAYTAAALQNDYRPRATALEAEQAERECSRRNAKLSREAQAQQAAQRERLRGEFDKQRLQQALDRLSGEELNALEKRFEQIHKGNPIFRKWFKDGYQNPVIQSLFRAFASDELLAECTEAEFTAWLNRYSVQGKDSCKIEGGKRHDGQAIGHRQRL
jgi:hypothetical protein